MTRLEIRLFGQIAIRYGGEPLSGLSSKATELLCYLLLHRERGHAREALAGLFWPDAPDPLAKKYLRQAIWRLQSKLTSGDLLIARADWIRINPQAVLWLDIAEFEQAYEFHRDVPGENLTDPQASALEAAIVLYRGDLIESWYQDWCVYERDRFQLIYLAMLEQLMSYCEACQCYAKGVAYGHHILRYDPARERTHRILMRLHYQAGDRTAALRQYERCAAAMAKQFSVHPSHQTVSLFRQIRGDHLEAGPQDPPARAQDLPARAQDPLTKAQDPPARPTVSAAAVTAPRATTEQAGETLTRLQASLDHLLAALTALQRQVQQQVAPVPLRQGVPAARPALRDALRENGRYTGTASLPEAR